MEYCKIMMAIVAGIFMLIGAWKYNMVVRKKTMDINVIVMASMFITATINSITYIVLTPDLAKGGASILMAAIAFATSANIFLSKKYVALKMDIIIIGAIIIGATGTMIFINPSDMYIATQIIASAATIVLIIRIIKKKSEEPFEANVYGLIGNIIALGPVVIDYTSIWSLIYPVRSTVFVAALVITIYVTNRKREASIGRGFFYFKNRIRYILST